MFQELMPLLAERTLLLLVSRVGSDEIRINVIPQRMKTVENDALFAPLSINGTPRELDEALPAQLQEFVEAHLGLSSTLKSVKEQMDAAAKAAREAARKQAAPKSGKSEGKGASGDAVAAKANVSTVASGISEDPSGPRPAEATTGSLFAT